MLLSFCVINFPRICLLDVVNSDGFVITTRNNFTTCWCVIDTSHRCNMVLVNPQRFAEISRVECVQTEEKRSEIDEKNFKNSLVIFVCDGKIESLHWIPR